ncbi:MAG: serine hydrolase domain-containing protein [Steroidobacteraceae bacterium]
MRALLVCLVVLLAGPQALAGADKIVDPTVDRIAKRYLDTTPIVGFGVTVMRKGAVIHNAGYGKARLDPVIPADAGTRFDYFSVGKHVTTALVLRLVERDLLDLDSPAGKYLPGLDPDYGNATLRQLLSHTSGMTSPEIDERDPAAELLVVPTRESLLDWLAMSERVAPPGETWLYCSDAFVVAATIAEQLTGASYRELVRREVAEPLGLGDFGFELTPSAQGYFVEQDTPAPIKAVPYEWFSGAGSIRGTTVDLARWWMALRSGKVIGEQSSVAITTPTRLASKGKTAEFGYGLGIRLGSLAGHRMIGHTGDAAGGTAVLAEYPDDDLLIVVATNTRGKGVPWAIGIQAEIARTLLGIEIGKPLDQPTPKALLADAPGFYVSPEGSFCVSARDDSLFVAYDDESPVRLLHQGNGVLMPVGHPAAEEYFLGGPGPTPWFAYRYHGFPMDLAVRTADACP